MIKYYNAVLAQTIEKFRQRWCRVTAVCMYVEWGCYCHEWMIMVTGFIG
jgi:hypothetical protein